MLSRRADAAEAFAPKLSADIPSSNVTVPSRTLDSLLEAHDTPIDFVALDLEGSEWDALQGFTLSRFRPRVIMIEDITLGQNLALSEFMKTQLYTHVGWIEMNAVYIRSDDSALLARFAKMSVFGW